MLLGLANQAAARNPKTIGKTGLFYTDVVVMLFFKAGGGVRSLTLAEK